MGLTVTGCCGADLRTAGIVHGWVGIAVLLLGISSSIGRITEFDPDDISIYSNSYTNRTIEQEQVILVIYVIDLLISGLLLLGISKNKHYLLLPWLAFRLIGLMVAIPVGLLVLFVSAYFVQPGMIAVSFIYSFIIGLFIWSWIVIYSLFDEIRTKSKNASPITTSAALPYYESQSGQLDPSPPYKQFEK